MIHYDTIHMYKYLYMRVNGPSPSTAKLRIQGHPEFFKITFFSINMDQLKKGRWIKFDTPCVLINSN